LANATVTRADVLKAYSLASADRILATIDGFRVTHGHWPTVVQVPSTMADNIKEHIFTARGWAMLLQRIEIKPDEREAIAAQDTLGNTFDYEQYSYAQHSANSNMRADVWIWGLSLSD
jgi:hypothetical protein